MDTYSSHLLIFYQFATAMLSLAVSRDKTGWTMWILRITACLLFFIVGLKLLLLLCGEPV